MATNYLIESDRTLASLRAAFPNGMPDGAGLVALADLVYRLAGMPPPEKTGRIELIRAALPQAFEWNPDSALSTLESLRLSMLFSEDDVDFAFSSLPPSPKNRALKRLALDYLESDLARDLAAATWEAIDRLKSGTVRLELGAHIVLVAAEEPSAVFREFAVACGYASDVESAELVALESLRFGPGTRLGQVRSSDLESGVDRVGSRVERLLAAGVSPSRIWVAFEGSPQTRWLLESRLTEGRVPFRSCLAERPVETPSPLAETIARVRRDTSFPLSDRLDLAGRLLAQSAANEADWQRLAREAILSERELERLRAATVTSAERGPTPQPTDAVCLAPFLALPLEEGSHWLGLYEPPLLGERENASLLLPSEREALHAAGFPVARPCLESERRQRVIDSLNRPAAFRRWMVVTGGSGTNQFREISRRGHRRTRPTLNESISLPDRPLSATHLETYVLCPARYYYSNRLRIRSKDRAEDRGALLFGQGVHRALEQFFQEPDFRATLERPAEFATELEARFLWEILGLAPELEWDRVTRIELLERVRALAPQIARLEAELVRIVGPTTPLAFEQAFEIEWHGIKLKGMIDRVDRLESGEVLVLDYKTGEVDFSPNQILRGEHFQALLYLVAAEKVFGARPAGLLFYDLKRGELRRGLLSAELVTDEGRRHVTRGHCLAQEKFEELLEKGAQAVKVTAAAIRAGDYGARPSPQTCRRCEFSSLCREAHRYV